MSRLPRPLLPCFAATLSVPIHSQQLALSAVLSNNLLTITTIIIDAFIHSFLSLLFDMYAQWHSAYSQHYRSFQFQEVPTSEDLRLFLCVGHGSNQALFVDLEVGIS